jgi:rhodanese-related sulfurtransferase
VGLIFKIVEARDFNLYCVRDHRHTRFLPGEDTVYLAPFQGTPYRGSTTVNPGMAVFLEFMAQQWTLFGALALAIGMFLFHESRRSGASLSPQQAINMVNKEEGVFVDLRDSADFGRGHVVDAVNIPATKLETRLAELESHRDKPIILVCTMGQNAGAAGKKLTELGFSRVYRMSGGMMEWGNMQLPLVK